MRPSYHRYNALRPKPSIEYLEKCKVANSELIKQVFKNNKYLLRKHGFTMEYQVSELRKQGVVISRSVISRYLRGEYTKCSLTFVMIFSYFWSISLWELMRSDLECSDQLLARAHS